MREAVYPLIFRNKARIHVKVESCGDQALTHYFCVIKMRLKFTK